MIPNNYKTSLLVKSQLPEFIRDDPSYNTFVTFVQAYYEWMELSANTVGAPIYNNVTDATKNLINYDDVDNTTDQFINYFYNDFLSNFPQDILANKSEVIKLAKQLYQSKGTPASYKFLFRVLYNSDVDFFYTKDVVLKASAGTWYVPVSLKLASSDTNFLSTQNLRIFGLTSKSIATIENAVLVQGKIEVFISNIERLFQSGELVTIVDSNNQPVYFFNGKQVFADVNGNYPVGAETLTAKIVGQISQININPSYRGLYYTTGSPVIVYGGLDSSNGIGATAQVGAVTLGSLQNINVLNGGYGYVLPSANASSTINITNITGANASVSTLNPAANGIATVTLPTDSISLAQYVQIGNTTLSFFANNRLANANTTLANSFLFTTLTTYPIGSVIVNNGGGGSSGKPVVTAATTYNTTNPSYGGQLSSLGILAPIQISAGGSGYVANDNILLIGGSGVGAYANVLTVNAMGSITSVGYVYPPNDSPHHYPLGGLGYGTNLPTISIASANSRATSASLYIPGVLGSGASFSTTVDRIGAVTTINITNYGEDYVEAPNVSLVVQDILVTGGLNDANLSTFPAYGDVVYQGANINVASYVATVNSAVIFNRAADPTQSVYNMRVFNYTSQPNTSLPLKITTNTKNVSFNISTLSSNVTNYGDGTARATATFLNGLTKGAGQYIDTSGQPSSFDVLQSTEYNNYTYEITLEKEIEKYRKTLLNILHPSGMQVLGRFAMKSNNAFKSTALDALYQGKPLAYYTGTQGSSLSMSPVSFESPFTNIVTLYNLAGANVYGFLSNTNTLAFTASNGTKVTSPVDSVFVVGNDDLMADSGSEDWLNEDGSVDLNSDSASYIILKDSVPLAFGNVAIITANANSNIINITSITNAYNIVNNGVYSNTMYPLMDIVQAGDTVLIANNSQTTVSSVDYRNNIVYLTGNLTNNANSYLSVSRTLTAYDGNITIFGPIGTQYFPQLTTEAGDFITTQDGRFILLG